MPSQSRRSRPGAAQRWGDCAATASVRASRRRSPRRSAQAANAEVGPCQRSSSTSREHLGGRAQRREVLEQQRELALVAEHLGRELLDGAVRVDEPRRRDLADAGNARDSRRRCRRRARAGRGCAPGPTPNFSRTPVGVAHRVAAAVDLHHAIAAHALREILVGRPDAAPAARGRRRRRSARPRRARRRPRARPSARRRRPSPRAPPRAARTARAARDRRRRRSCSPARGRCGTTRSRGRSRRRRASRRSRASAARCGARRSRRRTRSPSRLPPLRRP